MDNGVGLHAILCRELEYAPDLVLLAQLGESLQPMAHLVGQEAVCSGLVTNPDKMESLANFIKQPPIPDQSRAA